MSLETELKKSTTALVALTSAVAALTARLESEQPAPAQSARHPVAATDPLPTPPLAAPAATAQPAPDPAAPAPPAAATAPPPAAPAPAAAQPAPTPVATATPADDQQRTELVNWALSELGKVAGIVGPQTMLGLIQDCGAATVSEISSDRLPGLVVAAQNAAVAAQAGAAQ